MTRRYRGAKMGEVFSSVFLFVNFSKVCACLFPSQGCTHKSACHSVTVLPSGSRKQTKDLSSHVSNQALPSILLWKAALVHGACRNRWGHLHTLRPLSTVFFSLSSLCWTAVCFHELLSFAHSLRFGDSRLWLSGILYMATAFFQISLNRMLFFLFFIMWWNLKRSTSACFHTFSSTVG